MSDTDTEAGPDVRSWILGGVAIVVVAFALAALALGLGRSLRPHLYAGTVLQSDEPAPSLSELAFADGSPVDLAAFDDEVVLVFFGYTNCPDVCPLTLATAAQAIDELTPAEAERTNLVMISVDPERDDAESLEEYVGFFNPGFRGAGGPVEAIDRAATTYGVFYQLGQPDDDGQYLVDHTGTLFGIGPDGALRVVWSSSTPADALAADIGELLS